MAVARRCPEAGLLHHSDRGVQYACDDYQHLLKSHGMEVSMSGRGDCWDNAAMESFFSSLKVERVARKIYRTRDQAGADVFDYIERFYKPRRRHSTIGYLSPSVHAAQAGAQAFALAYIHERVAQADVQLNQLRAPLLATQKNLTKAISAYNANINNWIATWNDNPRPFVWHKTADEIFDSLSGYLQRISEAAH